MIVPATDGEFSYILSEFDSANYEKFSIQPLKIYLFISLTTVKPKTCLTIVNKFFPN